MNIGLRLYICRGLDQHRSDFPSKFDPGDAKVLAVTEAANGLMAKTW
jgi:hypothetical protein